MVWLAPQQNLDLDQRLGVRYRIAACSRLTAEVMPNPPVPSRVKRRINMEFEKECR